MGQRDVAHDGQAQAAAVGLVVQPHVAAEYLVALGRRDAGAGIFHRQHAAAVGRAAADGDRAMGWRVADGVVDQIVDQVAQQEAVALHGRRLQVEAQVDLLEGGLFDEMLDGLLHQGVERHRLEPGLLEMAGFGARQRQQLVGLPYHALGGRQHQPHRLGRVRFAVALGQPFELGLEAGQRRAQLVRHIGQEIVLGAGAVADPVQQAVKGQYHGAQLERHAGPVDGRQVVAGPRVEVGPHAVERLQAVTDGKPDQAHGGERERRLQQDQHAHDGGPDLAPLAQRLGDGDHGAAGGRPQRHGAHGFAPQHCIVGGRRTGAGGGRRREVGVAGEQGAGAVAHGEIDGVRIIVAQHLLGLVRQIDLPAAVALGQPRAQRAGRVGQGLVECDLGRHPRQQIGERPAGQVEQQDGPDQPTQQA